MDNFDSMIEALKANRQKLNQSNSFDEITQLWHKIKETYSECSKIIEGVSKELNELDEPSDVPSDLKDMKFSDALARMEKISAEIKTVSISKMPELVKEIYALKTFCLNKLETEKVKMEEVK